MNNDIFKRNLCYRWGFYTDEVLDWDNPNSANELLRDVIKNLQSILPVALLIEKVNNFNLVYFDLSIPYNTNSPDSLYYFIIKTMQLNKFDQKREYVNLYSDFIDYIEQISLHFRKIGETTRTRRQLTDKPL